MAWTPHLLLPISAVVGVTSVVLPTRYLDASTVVLVVIMQLRTWNGLCWACMRVSSAVCDRSVSKHQQIRRDEQESTDNNAQRS